ncbi:uncharacterized protein LOC116608319 isoform X2 [Nematostella vectensis]|uniref:uncharacterized protein LOC116608319 isoform X1 n=1 Tax=Nematostella vectensis TaxID=45351 RepID=UPI0013902FF8|nr:uncharacterized protein LOC116608319 isoform X1 [Nematostella vectensis]XP_048576878.1 uncharacterized protein LOC116608319 isoform X2 [Nematostella vectensis]
MAANGQRLMASEAASEHSELTKLLIYLPSKKQFKWNSNAKSLLEFCIKELQDGDQDALISHSSKENFEVYRFENITVNFYPSTKTVQLQGTGKDYLIKKLMSLLDYSGQTNQTTDCDTIEQESIVTEQETTDPVELSEPCSSKVALKDSSDQKGHDDRYQEFLDFKEMMKGFIEKFDKKLSDLSMDMNEQLILIKDLECQQKNSRKELIMEMDRKLDETKQDKVLADLKGLQSSHSKLGNKIRETKLDLEKCEQRLTFIETKIEMDAEESSDDDSEDEESGEPSDSEQVEQVERQINTQTTLRTTVASSSSIVNSPNTNDLPQLASSGNIESPINGNQQQIVDSSRTTRGETEPRPAQTATENTTRGNATLAETSGNILMLSDSIFGGIIQSRFARGRYVNKQYVQGGTIEMLDHLSTMGCEAGNKYEYVILHTGTNDIRELPTEQICSNIENIVEECIKLWPQSKIVVSGLTFHLRDHAKNDIIDVVNSASERLSSRCAKVYFADNRGVCLSRNGDIDESVYRDNVHLNNQTGTKKLVASLKSQIPGLRRQRDPAVTRKFPVNNRFQQRRQGAPSGSTGIPQARYQAPTGNPQAYCPPTNNPMFRPFPGNPQGYQQPTTNQLPTGRQQYPMNSQQQQLEQALKIISECVRLAYRNG